MASVPRSSGSLQPRSGGKIARTRQTLRSRTPYDRPNLSASVHEENPNWISRLVLSPTLMIANGAGKLLTSVFRHDSSSSSSSGSDSEEENEDEDNYNHVTCEGFEASKKNQTSEVDSSIKREVQVGRKETKRLIEQLLMQETFSRDECDRFIEILKSRVIESSNVVEAEDERLTETPKKIVGNDRVGPDLCSTAVLEARKWLNEKKSGSKSKMVYEQGNHISDDVVNEELHSPVDVAKSYMQARPRWASPFINHLELKSPPSGIQLFMEETKDSTGESSLPTSKLRKESPASGSWNIKEELRRVRSKATEEMLRNLPSKKIDWSSFASGNNGAGNSIGCVDKQNTYSEEKGQGALRTEDVPLTDSTAMPVLDMTHYESEDGAFLPDSSGFMIQQNEDPPNNLTIEGKSDQDFCNVRSSSNGQVMEKDHDKLAEEQNSNLCNHDTMRAAKRRAEEPCELLSEASVEVPNVNDTITAALNEIESIASGSQNSTSMQHGELSQEVWKANGRGMRISETVEDRAGSGSGSGRKLTRSNRKGRARGK